MKKTGYVREDLAQLWRENVPLILKALEISANDLGKEVGVTKQMIYNLVNHRNELTKMEFIAIGTVLNKKVNEKCANVDMSEKHKKRSVLVYWAKDLYHEIENEAKKGL